ncbi:MAG: phosphatidate cytidylyltransferase [Lachnospiraceae bacterium]|nr:phosphatidate cytidylyltransferase [Lachnospiraceae bacterium]
MKNSGFTKRAISAVFLVAILLAVGIAGGTILQLFCIIVATVGMKELYMATGLYNKDATDKKDNMLAVSGMVCCVLYFVVSGFTSALFTMKTPMGEIFTGSLIGSMEVMELIQLISTLGYMAASFIYVFVIFIIMAAIYVFSFPRFDFKKVANAIAIALYTPLFVTSIFLIRFQNDGKYLFWLIFISSWICDTCAYLVGCNIGKHKLAPVLSPKKSIEGAIGGVMGSVIVAFIFGYFVQFKLFGGNNYVSEYMIICFFGAIVSQVGDLFASAIKRNNDIKDYGTLIPGHGGIFDRFDSVIFVAPIIYILALILC